VWTLRSLVLLDKYNWNNEMNEHDMTRHVGRIAEIRNGYT
jgi:hypothetical protein